MKLTIHICTEWALWILSLISYIGIASGKDFLMASMQEEQQPITLLIYTWVCDCFTKIHLEQCELFPSNFSLFENSSLIRQFEARYALISSILDTLCTDGWDGHPSLCAVKLSSINKIPSELNVGVICWSNLQFVVYINCLRFQPFSRKWKCCLFSRLNLLKTREQRVITPSLRPTEPSTVQM